MSTEVSSGMAFAAAAAASCVATPFAIKLARRIDFYDHPRGYRQHAAATPFLGGAAVLAAFLIAGALIGSFSGKLLVLLGCAIALWVLGTLDDRFAVAPKWRIFAEALAAGALLLAGLGWKTTGGAGIDFVLSVIWVVGLVNAFNLMDNMDGACGAVASVSAAGIGTLAAIHDQSLLAGMAFGLAGAFLLFLRWNLARPARIFLGDGGSMLGGFLVAALGMATARHLHLADAGLLASALMVGIAMLDTALVSVSRIRRGVPLVTGGRDHLTHRLLMALRTPARVALVLALIQGALCGLAILGDQLGIAELGVFAGTALTAGLVTIAFLDSPRWRPADSAARPRRARQPASASSSIRIDSG